MKKLFFICALASSLAVTGQQADRDFNQLQLGILFSPDISNRVLTDEDQDGLFKFTENSSDPKLGFTTGFALAYNVSARWGFEIGIQFSNKGYEMSTSDLIFGDYIGGNRFYETQDPPIATYIRRLNYHYLDIPLRAIWITGQGNWRFVSSIGITSNFLLKVNEVNILELENGNRPRSTFRLPDEYNHFGLSPTLSVGVNYQLGDRFNLRAEPTLRYGLIETGSESGFSNYHEHLWSLGLNFICYYTLK